MLKFVQLVLISIPVLRAAKPSKPVVDVVLNDIQTENYAQDIVTLFEVYFEPFHGRRTISGAFEYNQVIPSMHLQFTLTFERPDKTRFDMLDLMINACSFLNGTYNKLKIPYLVLKELKQQKALPKKCPFEANKTFTWQNYEFQVPKFPLANLKFIYALTLYGADKKQKIVYIGLKGATKRFRS